MKNNIRRTILGAAVALAAMGVNAADISLVPDNGVDLTNITIGQEFDLTLQGENFPDGVSGFQIDMTWDPGKLQLLSTLPDINGSVLTNTGFTDILEATALDSLGGSLSAIYSTFGASIGLGGSLFTLFSLTFKAIPPAGSSDVTTVSAGGFIDSSFGQVLSVNYEAANITVTTNEVPLPAAVWLFGTGLLGLAGVARRRNQAEAA